MAKNEKSRLKYKSRLKIILLIGTSAWLLLGALLVYAHHTVAASVTTPSATSGSFDDPAIWIHPFTPTLSTILGTNKSSGLYVYDLAGTEIQNVTPSSDYNNVDIRYSFPLDGNLVDLVAVSQRGPSDRVALFVVDPTTRMLTEVSGDSSLVGFEPYGLAMYHSPQDGKFYAFVSGRSDDEVRQYELFDNGSGLVDINLTRIITITSLTEGIAADDVTGLLYLAEEDIGIYRYGAEPTDGQNHITIDEVGGTSGLTADVEGLSLYYANIANCPTSQGYLLASNQGADSYHIYERAGTNNIVHQFEITVTSNTDGIDVTNVDLGGDFDKGLFAVQNNDVNFKFVSWQDIATGTTSQTVCVDTSWLPRVDPNPLLLTAQPTTQDLLELTWQDLLPDSGVCYDVYRNSAPYFTPNLASLYQTNLAASTVLFLDLDVDVIGNINTNYFYIMQATNCNGVLVADSNEMGEFDFAIES